MSFFRFWQSNEVQEVDTCAPGKRDKAGGGGMGGVPSRTVERREEQKETFSPTWQSGRSMVIPMQEQGMGTNKYKFSSKENKECGTLVK
jgi:hypothetical protein